MNEFISVNGDKLPVGTFYCIGKNYSAHAKEMGGEVPQDPIIFIKPPNAFTDGSKPIKLPAISNNVHYETELVVLIGKDTDQIAPEEAGTAIEGFAIGWDLTMRDVQNQAKSQGHPWAIAKGFKQSAPVSKYIPYSNYANPNHEFELKFWLNGNLRQQCLTSAMERQVSFLVHYIASIFGLKRGDAIFTGTPEGVGAIKSGDTLVCSLSETTGLTIEIE